MISLGSRRIVLAATGRKDRRGQQVEVVRSGLVFWVYFKDRVDSFLVVWMLNMGTKDKSRRIPKEDLLLRIKKGSYKDFFKKENFFLKYLTV